jgi:hypothetical protein
VIISIGCFKAGPADPIESFLTTVPEARRLERDAEWHGRQLIVKVAPSTAAASAPPS